MDGSEWVRRRHALRARRAANRLRLDLAAGALPFPSERVLEVTVADGDDLHLGHVVVVAEAAHLDEVRELLARHLEGTLSDEDLTVEVVDAVPVPGPARRVIDPRSVIGQDVPAATATLEADGWHVRVVRPGDVITLENRPDRVNLHLISRSGQVVGDVGAG